MIRLFGIAGTAAALAGLLPHPHQAAAGAAEPVTPAPAAAPQQDFHWRGRIAQGEQIQVLNIIGDIRAEPTDGDEVTVTGVRSGRGAERIRVEVVRRASGTVICAIYPGDGGSRWRDDDDDDDRGEPRDACNSRRRVTIDDDDGRVNFTVRVPAGVRLAARTVSGNVEARRLRGPVDARSVSGDVRVATAGPVEASSVSGDVFAELGRMGDRDLEFRSVSGSVTLEVPAGIDADFEAGTLSGSIESDFPVQLARREGRGRYNIRVGQQARARLGRGGPTLHVTTVSGDVTLRRAR
ncbi:MAG TPA: hypothetical protein VF092_20625 [Longimicrobium sp.]